MCRLFIGDGDNGRRLFRYDADYRRRCFSMKLFLGKLRTNVSICHAPWQRIKVADGLSPRGLMGFIS